MFEKYQNFFAIILCGALIGGGIIISKTIPQKQFQEKPTTKADVTQELITTARKLNVNASKLTACLESEQYQEKINADVLLAEKSGASGTPTFFILQRTFSTTGDITSEKQFPIVGAQPKEIILEAIAQGVAPTNQPPVSGEKIVLSETDHWLGSRTAPTVIVMYSDIDCPFCKRAEPVIQNILAENSDIALVYRHSPITSLHPFAAYKAEATECVKQIAGEETFWKFLRALAE